MPTAERHRVRAALGIVFALLLAQWLALAHATLHPQGRSRAAQAAPADASAKMPLRALFAHDDGSADCRLFDQLTHAQPLPPAPPAIALAPLHLPEPAPVAERLATADGAPYAARGPPQG